MRFITRSLLALCALTLALTAVLAWLSPRLHADVMQQIEASGIVKAQHQQYNPGFLSASHDGELLFASSYCAGCDVMQFTGQSFHGLGALSRGQLAVASLEYALSWPDLPLQPALPPLTLSAIPQLSDDLHASVRAELNLSPDQHRLTLGDQLWHISHQGLSGDVRPGQLQLRVPEVQLKKQQQDQFGLEQLQLSAAASDALQINGKAASLALGRWHWAAQDVQLQYQQHGSSDRLHANAVFTAEHSELAGESYGASSATVSLDKLNLDATIAFARELPRLLSPEVSGAARMLGLFSLYSLHGPAFFAPKPEFRLHSHDLPLYGARAQLDIELAVTPTTHRPPMHPMEWRRALRGQVDIIAPEQQLKQAWESVATMVNFATGLPLRFEALRSQGWIQDVADNQVQLAFELDPLLGPIPLKRANLQATATNSEKNG